MFANLTGTDDSVHFADWPEADRGALDDALDREMELARDLVSLGRAARTDAKLRVRQPLGRAILLLPAGTTLSDAVRDEVADELNVHAVEIVHDLEGLLDYEVVPNFRALGPRVGRLMPALQAALAATDGSTLRRALDDGGSYELDVEGVPVRLDRGDVDIRARSHEELALAQEGALAVALDTRIDAALAAEGAAREVVRFVNDQRKAAGLVLSDRIRLRVWAAGPAQDAIAHHRDWIAGEVLATELVVGEPPARDEDHAAALDLDGQPVHVALERVAPPGA
jgi:isoleucyl-tRNA synthetase